MSAPANKVAVSTGAFAKVVAILPAPPNNDCTELIIPPKAGPNAWSNPVSICWNWLDKTFDACSNVVRPFTKSVPVFACSSNTEPVSVILLPNSIMPPCSLKNSTCPVTVAFLNLSTLPADRSLILTNAFSLVTTPDIKSFTTCLAPGMFCTSANADSVTGTPALAIKSWKPSARSGDIPAIVPANAWSLWRVSSVAPCKNAWNLSFALCCSICLLNSSLCCPVSFANLSNCSAKFIALSLLCVSVRLLRIPVLLCESKFNNKTSFISSIVNPSGANLLIPTSLTCLPSSAIPLAPCVVDPNNAANDSEFCPINFAKSSIGSAASAAANLRSTIDCPKLAPTAESCLNVSMLVSNTLPTVCRP